MLSRARSRPRRRWSLFLQDPEVKNPRPPARNRLAAAVVGDTNIEAAVAASSVRPEGLAPNAIDIAEQERRRRGAVPRRA